MSVKDDQGETTGRLWLAGAGWALLTLVLMALLGFGLPVLLLGSLGAGLLRGGVIVAGVAGLSLAGATAALLKRDTHRRYAARPHLLRALLIGHTVAVVIGVPTLLALFTAALLFAFGA